MLSVPAKRKGEKKDDESKGETKMPKKEERIKSYEYKKWDNFDVDAELKKIEENSIDDTAKEQEIVDEAVLLQGPNSIEYQQTFQPIYSSRISIAPPEMSAK